MAVVAGDHNRRFPISDMVAERDVDDQGVIVRFADHTAQVIYTQVGEVSNPIGCAEERRRGEDTIE